jgi:hypothetical protein
MHIAKTERTIQPRDAHTEGRALIDRLESRVYFAHFGHEVLLPDAALNGEHGLETAIDAPANHRRGKLVIGTGT